MAKRRKRQQALLKKVLIIGGALILVQVVLIFYFKSNTNPKSIRDEIDDKVKKASVPSSQRREMLRIQLAINDYRITIGKLPSTLDELRPKYFDQVPLDPDTKAPFKYEVVGDKFTLGDKKASAAATPKPGQPVTPEQQTAQEQSLLIASLDQGNEQAPFVYDPTGKRDPFRPFDLSPKLDPEQCAKEPLTCYQIGQLKLTAVLGGTEMPSANVEDSAGKGFIVKKGTKIGPNGGEVVEILPDRLKILETIVDFTGETKSNVVEMMLRTKDSQGRIVPGGIIGDTFKRTP